MTLMMNEHFVNVPWTFLSLSIQVFNGGVYASQITLSGALKRELSLVHCDYTLN